MKIIKEIFSHVNDTLEIIFADQDDIIILLSVLSLVIIWYLI